MQSMVRWKQYEAELNPGKCHYMLIGSKSHDIIILKGVEHETSNE